MNFKILLQLKIVKLKIFGRSNEGCLDSIQVIFKQASDAFICYANGKICVGLRD
jgi:hypothetical protein